MPITDNSFTKEEFLGAAQANPDLVTLVAGVITADETNPFRKLIEPEIVGPVTKKHAETIEADVKALFEIEKKPNEKYFDYLKRAATEKLGTVKQMQTELQELREKGTSNKADKDRIAALEAGLAAEKSNYEKKLQDKDKELNQARAGYDTRSEIAKLKFKAGIPESLLTLAQKTTVDEIAKQIVYQEDGTPTFLDANGKVALDPATYKPITIAQKVTELMADIIDTGKQQQGGGTKPNDKNPAGGDKNKTGADDPANNFTGVPPEVKTRVQLTDYLYSLGITTDNPKFDEIFETHGKGLKLK